jgi:hypothetical protein
MVLPTAMERDIITWILPLERVTEATELALDHQADDLP